jgi:hypothetical protein
MLSFNAFKAETPKKSLPTIQKFSRFGRRLRDIAEIVIRASSRLFKEGGKPAKP